MCFLMRGMRIGDSGPKSLRGGVHAASQGVSEPIDLRTRDACQMDAGSYRLIRPAAVTYDDGTGDYRRAACCLASSCATRSIS